VGHHGIEHELDATRSANLVEDAEQIFLDGVFAEAELFGDAGIDPVDFELWCTAVSAINGCGLCVDSHEQVLRGKGMTEETILAAVRLASVIHGLATVFDTEAVLPSQPVTV